MQPISFVTTEYFLKLTKIFNLKVMFCDEKKIFVALVPTKYFCLFNKLVSFVYTSYKSTETLID